MGPPRPFAVGGRQVWLSQSEQDLLRKMRPTGSAARDENGRLILECADGSSHPCAYNPQGVRDQLIGLETHGVLVSEAYKHWSLTDYGREVRAELMRQGEAQDREEVSRVIGQETHGLPVTDHGREVRTDLMSPSEKRLQYGHHEACGIERCVCRFIPGTPVHRTLVWGGT